MSVVNPLQPFTLNYRQTRLYLSQVAIVRPTAPPIDPVTKARGDDTTFNVVVTDNWPMTQVPALFRYTQNDSDPSSVARIKRRTDLVEDKIKVPVGVDVRDGDFVVNLTPGPNQYQVHHVEGPPRVRQTLGYIDDNEQMLRAMVEEKPPFNPQSVVAGAPPFP